MERESGARSRSGRRVYRAFQLVLYGVALGIVTYLFLAGRSYYETSLGLRPRHPEFWLLKPGGSVGHLYGVIGSSLMILMALYSLRKRASWLRRAGALRYWLDFHIFCGVIGPLLVVLHSSFKVGGLVALSFWSMVVVAVSGVFGRVLYLQIPRRRSGEELSLGEMEAARQELARRLREDLGVSSNVLERLDEVSARGADPEHGLLRVLLSLPLDRWRLRQELAELGRDLGRQPRRLRRQVLEVARRKVVLQRRILLLDRLQQLFYYWHVLHKPFAVVMYLFMVVHVAVAILTGYAWKP